MTSPRTPGHTDVNPLSTWDDEILNRQYELLEQQGGLVLFKINSKSPCHTCVNPLSTGDDEILNSQYELLEQQGGLILFKIRLSLLVTLMSTTERIKFSITIMSYFVE